MTPQGRSLRWTLQEVLRDWNCEFFFAVISNKLDGDMLSIIIKCIDLFIDQGESRRAVRSAPRELLGLF